MSANDPPDTTNLHRKQTRPLIPDDRAELERRYVAADAKHQLAVEANRDLRAGYEATITRLESVIKQEQARIRELEESYALALLELEERQAPLDILLTWVNRLLPNNNMTHEEKTRWAIKEYKSMATENAHLRAERPTPPAPRMADAGVATDRNPTPPTMRAVGRDL